MSYWARSATAVLALSCAGQALALQDFTVFQPSGMTKQNLVIADAPNPGGDAVTINLLAVYSRRFEAQLSAQGYVVADYIQQAYREVNRYFSNTGLDTRIRLAGLLAWDLPAGAPIVVDNDSLVSYVEQQTGARDALAADLVQLWEVTEAGIDDPNICGWGQTIGPHRVISTSGFGYSTLAQGQARSAYAGCYAAATPEVMAQLAGHEIGHNLGSTHAWGEDSGDGAFEFARGQLCGDRVGDYPQGTIMSTSGFRLPFFSTPTLFLDGDRCGEPVGQPYAADNRETFTRTASAIAALRSAIRADSQVWLEVPERIGELTGVLPIVLERDEARAAGSVELLLFGESAQAGADFFAPASQIVSFAPGETRVVVEVSLHTNDGSEGEETLVVWLQRPQGMQITGGRGFRVSIVDGLLTALGGLLDDVLGTLVRALPLPGSDLEDAEPAPLPQASPSQASADSSGGGGAVGAGLLLLGLRRWWRPGRVQRPGV